MANLKLLQIGDRSFHIHDQDLFPSHRTRSDAKQQDFLFSPQKGIANSQWLYKEQSFSTKGTHVSTPSYDADLVTQELRSWVGKPTVIIAYVMPSGRPEAQGSNCACQCVGDCACNIIYLQSFGVLTEVESSVDDPFQPPELSIDVDLFDFWRELDNYAWAWGSGIAQFPKDIWYPDDPDGDTKYLPIRDDCGGEVYYNPFPSCEQLFKCDNGCGNFIHIDWMQDSFYYDEFFWNELYNNDCYGRDSGISGECAIHPNIATTVNIDRGVWGAPPLSMYSFSLLPTDGSLSIYVERKNGLSVEKVSSLLDLDQLNTDMNAAGYGDIQLSDRLLVGDIRRYSAGVTYRPSFIQRSCEILDVRPRWNYPDWFPGMLYPGTNRFYFDYSGGTGDASQIEASYVHHFRRV